MLADEGHFDEILGVPDHPRFKEEEEEEEEEASKPGTGSAEMLHFSMIDGLLITEFQNKDQPYSITNI